MTLFFFKDHIEPDGGGGSDIAAFVFVFGAMNQTVRPLGEAAKKGRMTEAHAVCFPLRFIRKAGAESRLMKSRPGCDRSGKNRPSYRRQAQTHPS